MPRKKKKSTTESGLRVSYPTTKKSRRREDDDHWSSDFEDGIEAGFAVAEIVSDALVAILRRLAPQIFLQDASQRLQRAIWRLLFLHSIVAWLRRNGRGGQS